MITNKLHEYVILKNEVKKTGRRRGATARTDLRERGESGVEFQLTWGPLGLQHRSFCPLGGIKESFSG